MTSKRITRDQHRCTFRCEPVLDGKSGFAASNGASLQTTAVCLSGVDLTNSLGLPFR